MTLWQVQPAPRLSPLHMVLLPGRVAGSQEGSGPGRRGIHSNCRSGSGMLTHSRAIGEGAKVSHMGRVPEEGQAKR